MILKFMAVNIYFLRPSISAAAQAKKEAENAELQTYIESILQPTNDDIETAIQLVCAPPDKSKGSNGFKSRPKQAYFLFYILICCLLYLMQTTCQVTI